MASVATLPTQPTNHQLTVVDVTPPPFMPVLFGDFAPDLQVNPCIEFAVDSATLQPARPEEVQRHLMKDCGINPGRLDAIGVGEQFPPDMQDPKAAANRRVEFQALG